MERWGAGFLGVVLGIPREAPGIPRGAQGSLTRSLEVPKGSPELGFPEARDPLAARMGWLGWLGSMESPMGY